MVQGVSSEKGDEQDDTSVAEKPESQGLPLAEENYLQRRRCAMN